MFNYFFKEKEQSENKKDEDIVDNINNKNDEEESEIKSITSDEGNDSIDLEPQGLIQSITEDRALWRDLLSYWLLGFCNDFGIFVILTAALDLVEQFSPNIEILNSGNKIEKRPCQLMSTGVILLADCLPELIVKSILPFVPFWVSKRIYIKISASVCGYILVGVSDRPYFILLGVILISASAGLGEATLLQYCVQFNSTTVGAWSSGTGAAGLVGSCIYAGIKSFHGYRYSLLILLLLPTIEFIVFFVLLRTPSNQNLIKMRQRNAFHVHTLKHPSKRRVHFDDEVVLTTIKEKFIYSLKLTSYIFPLIFVNFAQNLINNGMYELIYFENTFLDHEAQYRWLNVIFQLGLFISKSSLHIFKINQLGFLAVLQCLNLIYVLLEIRYYITPVIWLIFIVAFWEGIIGGAIYLNTFYRILKKIPPTRQEFAIGLAVITLPLSVMLAGFLSIPLHNIICTEKKPIRKNFN